MGDRIDAPAGGVTRRSPGGQDRMIALAGPTLEAGLRLDGRTVVTSLRHRGAELLVPPGVPLLHPWANRLSAAHYLAAGRRGRVTDAPWVERDGHGLAIHGLVPPRHGWTVAAATPGRLLARLYHPADAGRHAAFPYPHLLEVETVLAGDALTVRTTLTATADVAVPVAFGYHPYLRLPGVPRRAWRVQLPAMRALELDLDGIPTGRSWPRGPWRGALAGRAWDDAYADVPVGAEMVLEGGGRRIAVRFDRGYPVAQVFAPRAADVVCFEPMTAPVDALVSGSGLRFLPPGAACTATFSIVAEDA